MAKVEIIGCGGCDESATLNVTSNDFGIKVNNKFYRFDIDEAGNLTICLINGVDVKVTTQYGYPAIKLFYR